MKLIAQALKVYGCAAILVAVVLIVRAILQGKASKYFLVPDYLLVVVFGTWAAVCGDGLLRRELWADVSLVFLTILYFAASWTIGWLKYSEFHWFVSAGHFGGGCLVVCGMVALVREYNRNGH